MDCRFFKSFLISRWHIEDRQWQFSDPPASVSICKCWCYIFRVVVILKLILDADYFLLVLCLGHHLWFLHGVVSIGQFLSSHCMDGGNWSWDIFWWRLDCTIWMFWTHSLCKCLVPPGRLAGYYFLLSLWIGSKVLLTSHSPAEFVQLPCEAGIWRCYPCISIILLAKVISPKYSMYKFTITGDNSEPIAKSCCWYIRL